MFTFIPISSSTIQISAVNDPPKAPNVTAVFNGTTTKVTVPAKDADGPSALEIMFSSKPRYGSLTQYSV